MILNQNVQLGYSNDHAKIGSEAKVPSVRKVSADGNAVTLGTVGEKANPVASTNNSSNTSVSSAIKWVLSLLVVMAIAISGWRVWCLIYPAKQKPIGTSF